MIAPIPMILVDDPDAESAPVGAFRWERIAGDRRWINVKLPRGLTATIQVILGEPPDDGTVRWGWDGNVTAPTLRPSLRCTAHRQWHGWITAGQLETHEDSQDG